MKLKDMSSESLVLIVYGATGFMGQLVATYLDGRRACGVRDMKYIQPTFSDHLMVGSPP